MEEAVSKPELMDDASSAPRDANTPAAASSGQQDELADDGTITGADSGLDALHLLGLSSQHKGGTSKCLSEDIESGFQCSDIAKSKLPTGKECISFDFEESTSDYAQSASGIQSPLLELKGDQVNKDAANTSYLAQSTSSFQTPPEEPLIHPDILHISPFEPISEVCQLCSAKLCHEPQDYTILPCGHRLHRSCVDIIYGPQEPSQFPPCMHC